MLSRLTKLIAPHGILLALALLLLASLALNYAVLRHLRGHDGVPPSQAPFVAGKCGASSLVGHWNFEHFSRDGRLAADESGHANHARVEVADRLFAPVRFRPAAQVDGIDGHGLEVKGRQWLGAGNNDCFTAERFTVAVWIWLDDVGTVPTIIGKSAWPHNGWFLLTTTRGIQAQDRYLDLGILWPGGRAHVESGYQVPLREWHHVVVTVDNERREVQFFVDGKSVSRHTDVPKWQVNWDQELVIGDYDGSTRWPWIGKIDDVRFYNHVLDEAECLALYGKSTTDVALR
jgi:hypothetical protein